MLRNSVSGPEIGLSGRLSAGVLSGKSQNRLAGLRPAGGPILRLPRLESGRKQTRKPDFLSDRSGGFRGSGPESNNKNMIASKSQPRIDRRAAAGRTSTHVKLASCSTSRRYVLPVLWCSEVVAEFHVDLSLCKIHTLGFLIHGFWAGQKSSILGVWAALAAPKTIPKGGGLRPLPFGMVCWAAGAAHTPKIEDLRPAQKPCIKNPSIIRLCQG